MGRVSMIGRTAIFNVPAVFCGAQAERKSIRLSKRAAIFLFIVSNFLF
jgi:hypothetical protein